MVLHRHSLFRKTTTAPPIKLFSLIYSLSGFYSEQAASTRHWYYCLLTDWLIFVTLFATVYQILTSPSMQQESLSVSFVVCIASSLALYYSICFRLQSPKFREVISLLGQARASLAKTLDDDSVFKGFEMDVKNNKLHNRFGLFASFTSAFLFSVHPLMRSAGVFGMDGSKQLQIDIWCPFDYKSPILFESMVLFQFFTVFLVALRIFANDSFYMFLFQLNIRCFVLLTSLGENVFKREPKSFRNHERMSNRTMNLKLLLPITEENGFIENVQIVSYHRNESLEFNDDFNSSAQQKLKLFIKTHQLVSSCSQKVCEVYGPVMLMYLLSLMGFMSVGAFGVMHTNGFEGVQSIAVILFSIANLMGMYFMCKAGDDLAEKSGDAARDMVDAGWFVCSQRVTSALVIVLQRVATRVQACVVGTPSMPLSCNTYAWFIKTMVSFYLCLVEVQGVKKV